MIQYYNKIKNGFPMDHKNNILDISDNEFCSILLKSKNPILVDFWADWCTPCKSMTPILQNIAKKYAKKLKLVKINIEKYSDTQEKYLIRSIPTLILFFNQSILGKKIGVCSQNELEIFLDTHLKKSMNH
ncbi:MAG: thioredoxin [Wigglesworthia glossinidia]|nr:thioredoxin [Wigglesworthia glossinidia]